MRASAPHPGDLRAVISKKIACLFIGMVAALAVRADVIPSFVSATATSGGNTVWSYQIDITSDQQVTTGDFFTIHDFGNFIPGTNMQPTNWSFSSLLVGPTPSGVHPADDPNIPNLTWTYTGSATIPTNTTLGPFSVTLAGTQFVSAPVRQAFFSAQATRSNGPNAGTKVNNVGQVPVPIPEPSSLALLVLAGLSGLAFYRRSRS